MQRSCSALAVLLTLIASSVLVVDRVQSQSPGLGVTCLPGPASVCGFIAGNPRIVLGQSVGDEYDTFWGDSCYAEYVASDDANMRDNASLLATEELVVRQNQWWNTLGTGYDAAYDFAMHGGKYLEIEIADDYDAGFLAVSEPIKETIDDYGCQLGGRWECDDFHCIRDDRSETSGIWTCQWTGCDLTQTENSMDNLDCDLDDAIVSTPELWSAETSAWMIRTVREASSWAEGMIQSATDAERIASIQSQVKSFAIEAWSSDESETYTNSATDRVVVEQFDEEVLVLTTANTLEQIAMSLQDAAEHLRSWAANRIVAKHRRVARNSR